MNIVVEAQVKNIDNKEKKKTNILHTMVHSNGMLSIIVG